MSESGNRPRRIALTGGIATGKSHVRAQFEHLGVPTIDADRLARDAVAPGTSGLAAVVARFGQDILEPNGTLDRRTLATRVFADTAARRDLEAIIHPIVITAADAWFASLDPRHPIAIDDIPLLYETGREQDFEKVIVVACEPEEQVRRVMQRNGLSESEARARIAAQWPIAEKLQRADYVIRTDGPFDETNRHVKDVWNQLIASS